MAGSNFRLALVVLLAELFCCFRVQGDAHSLCYAFNVSASGPSWCEVRGKIDGTPFLKYTCRSLKTKPISPLGVMLNATDVWNQVVDHWKDLVEELRKALLDNQQHIPKDFGFLSLQGHMMCQQKFIGQPRAFWEFSFNGQMCLHFDSKKRSWTELHSGCRSLKETLESNRYDVTDLLVVISHGDCVKLLNQSRVLDTKAASIVGTTMAPIPDPSKAMIIKYNIALILTLIFMLITLGV